ncbi:hypothetical protein F3Y22_tig00112249pilonHSYRG00227 [Hibiscus syriacus]|uniref:Uncharacterized protein n=1 Tax=Hibiscus syriacus TaxID=106335 RepID=A0A6A2YAU3_HIBSY|nr:hypothetical protein F3Y22_tig00112249pilonHSYRG00227 [Hibiscus syriacus]
MLFCSTVVGIPFLLEPMVITREILKAWNSCSQKSKGEETGEHTLAMFKAEKEGLESPLHNKKWLSVQLELAYDTDLYVGDSDGNIKGFKIEQAVRHVIQMKYTIPFSASHGCPTEVLAGRVVMSILPQPTAEKALISHSTPLAHESGAKQATGEKVNYYEGRPVSKDYNGGSKVIHSHKNCTEWAPNVYFENDKAINLEAELSRSRKIKCSCCGLKGAALGCFEKSCNNVGSFVILLVLNFIQVWDLEKRLSSYVHVFKEEITSFAAMQTGPYMYVGDSDGNIKVLKIEQEVHHAIQMKYSIPFSSSHGNFTNSLSYDLIVDGFKWYIAHSLVDSTYPFPP